MAAAFKTFLIFIGFILILLVIYIIFMINNPTDYAQLYVKKSLAIGNVYELKLRKDKVLERLNPSHGYSDTIKNLTDSLFVIYLHISNNIRINALVRIIEKNETKTIIKFDSITGYSYFAFLDTTETTKIIKSYDSLKYIGLFDKSVIQIINNDSIDNSQLYFDNKLIMDQNIK
jgi:hypothetical protein